MRPCAPRSPTRCSASTPSSPRRSPRSCWRRRRRGRWATSPAPSPSSWPAACARRRAPSPPRSSPALGPIPGISQAVAAPNGYVNVFLDRAAAVRLALGVADEGAPAPEPLLPAEKTIVEHTAINPNKAAHIGHLRNTTLGDTLVRLLRYGGVPVEVQNYIDDTGVQVADVVVGFEHLEHKTLDEVRAIADSTRFDYYCWDLYARVTEWYDARSRAPVGAQRDAARHRARRQRHRGARRLHRRSHRPDAPRDDGAAERRLRPPDVGGRHPAPEVLGHRLRPAARERHDVQADRGQAGRLLGDADRRGRPAKRRPPKPRRSRLRRTPRPARTTTPMATSSARR